MITMQEAVRQRLEQLMNEQGLTISELARRSALRQSTVQDIAKGKSRNPSMQAVYQIALGLGLTLSEFTRKLFLHGRRCRKNHTTRALKVCDYSHRDRHNILTPLTLQCSLHKRFSYQYR